VNACLCGYYFSRFYLLNVTFDAALIYLPEGLYFWQNHLQEYFNAFGISTCSFLTNEKNFSEIDQLFFLGE
jgi:hypothetical protein